MTRSSSSVAGRTRARTRDTPASPTAAAPNKMLKMDPSASSPVAAPPGDENRDVNLPPVDASVPTAKEEEAARLARVRLGLEAPRPGDENSMNAPEEERLPTGQEPDKVEIVHVPTAELQPLADDAMAEAAVDGLPATLGAPPGAWVATCAALHLTRQLAVHHAAILQPTLPEVAKAVLGTVKNLRSAVQKSALLCLCDLLDTYADQLLPVLAGPQGGAPAAAPIQQVLLKASQDKRFVADEAQRALRTMAEKCAPALAQALLIPLAAHKNPKVRAEAATAVGFSVAAQAESEGATAVAGTKALPPLLKLAGDLISDAQPGARAAAQALLATLHEAFAQVCDGDDVAEQWEAVCTTTLSSSSCAKVLKCTAK